MHRTFETSTTRRQHSLDGLWEFVLDPADDGLEAGYHGDFPDDADRIDVPAPWNVAGDAAEAEYESPAWYRRTFDLPEETTGVLTFHGVCHDATVWLDGERVASHYGGHTPISVVDGFEAGTHELVVRADNTRDERSIPRPGTDWFPYGGITREVVLEVVPDIFVEDLRVEYELDDDSDRAAMTATVTVRNEGETTDRSVSVELVDEALEGEAEAEADTETEIDPGTTQIELDLEADVERWSPHDEDPQLYTVVATVGSGDRADELRERIGFRTVAVTETDILVNGEPVELLGVNRHEDHPEWGHTQPLRLQRLDLDVIEDAGMNTVRTSHYPNHPRFLDCCDERGILVLEEIPYWQFDADRFAREGVLERGETTLREMIGRDRHHPSILAWSLTNECANEEEGVREATEKLADVARGLDDRPLTLASNNYHPDGDGEDLCLEHVDFVCMNAYPGWYQEGDYADVIEGVREDFPEMPIVASEFGAGAVFGERTRENQKWSEGYQADFVEDAVETFRETECVAGFTIWQYCDTRTDPRNWATRPKTKNNKGIVDEYRRPKEAYNRVRDLLEADGDGDR
ncbi:glycoside hydrolase family 2 protein [Halomontanus rarus]|uniref:glycoside hydrolase family 2 protein n=1 Tax=Halomontanus rarus TaxID=3034020 RepID=UPI0023E82D0B|nr:glycoside hydrolase family 2 TIM barrel-domain containing protein [Halovivax sp. TS33]